MKYQTISRSPLPLAQNFKELKALGLKFLQELSGHRWNHLNDSDPGTTILEQLCYGLIELGYCLDFPIEDILSEQLSHKDRGDYYPNQFYRPKELLTTTPVTTEDHIKWLTDQLPGVQEIRYGEQNGGTFYLRFHPHVIPEVETLRAHRLLQQCRTLGEPAYNAAIGKISTIHLSGDVYLHHHASVKQVKAALQQRLDLLFAHRWQYRSYEDLRAEGQSAEDIFNGPALSRGWLHRNSDSGQPSFSDEHRLTADLLVPVVSQVNGVEATDQLKFDARSKALLAEDQHNTDFFVFDLQQLSFYQFGHKLELSFSDLLAPDLRQQQLLSDYSLSDPLQRKGQNSTPDKATQPGTHIRLQPPVIKGQAREIEQYYSVQYTFPAIYGIGDNEVAPSEGSARIAQARQLQGYLLIFDQLLANQFSQVAHLRQLFSFKSHVPKAPAINQHTQEQEYDAGIPLQGFSPTYYAQPLYNINQVQPLLKGHQEYQWRIGGKNNHETGDETSDKLQAWQAWQQYQQDLFNPYVSGLRNAMESEHQANLRREKVLNHLLARHGEDGERYDALITVPLWYGSLIKTRNIIKGQLLQNYGRLSFNRSKGYSATSAETLHTPAQCFSDEQQSPTMVRKILLQQPLPQAMQFLLGEFTPPGYSDGRLDIELLDAEQQITPAQLNNYSTFELTFNLVTGLSHYYRLLISLLLQLLRDQAFRDWLDEPLRKIQEGIQQTSVTLEDSTHLRFEYQQHHYLVYSGEQEVLKFAVDGETLPSDILFNHLQQMAWLATRRCGMLLLERALYPEHCQRLDALQSAQPVSAFGYPLQADIYTLIPAYISRFNHQGFTTQFDYFAQYYCPAQCFNQLQVLNFAQLEQEIHHYTQHHNDLIEQASTGDFLRGAAPFTGKGRQ